MSAAIKDDDEGPVDREAVISNLIMHRLQEFLELDQSKITLLSLQSSIERSLQTMKRVFKITHKVPLVEVMAGIEPRTVTVNLRHPKTKELMTIQDWLES